MSYLTQKTIKNNISFRGISLHSGLDVNVCIKPASPNNGIVFKRVDLKNNNLVYPNFMNVTNTSLNTTIENESGVKVSTIEHLMCALFGMGIDNALIEIDNDEVPILDGSAKIFIEKIISTAPSDTIGVIVGVDKAGCNGYSYKLDFAKAKDVENLEYIQQNEVKVFIDPKATMFLLGSEMDYSTDKLSSRFIFKNPNEKSTCGCGESFSV